MKKLSSLRRVPHAQRRLWLGYIAGAFGLGIASQVSFLVPLRARELGADFSSIGLIVGASSLAAALSAVTSGAIIDRWGPRASFLFGTAGTAIVSVGFVTVTNYWWFLALQPLHGIVRNTAWLASQNYTTGDVSGLNRARAAGRFGFFGNAGQMIGPAIAGLAASLVGFRWAFLVSAAYALAFWVLGLGFQRKRSPLTLGNTADGSIGFRSAMKLLARRGIQVVLLLTFARLWISHTFSTFFPVFLVENNLEPGVAGLVVASSGLVATTVSLTAGFWSRLLGERVTVAIGLGCGALGIAFAPLAHSIPQALVTPLLVGMGAGLSLPLLISLMSSSAPENMRGVALGVRGLVNQIAATAAPVVIGPLMAAVGLSVGFVGAGVFAGGVIFASAMLFMRGKPAESR